MGDKGQRNENVDCEGGKRKREREGKREMDGKRKREEGEGKWPWEGKGEAVGETAGTDVKLQVQTP